MPKREEKFERRIFYSEEDHSWIGVAPALRGCSAFGSTPEKALRELEIAIGFWLEVRTKKGMSNRKQDKPKRKRT